MLGKLGVRLSKLEIDRVANCAPEAIEIILLKLRAAILHIKEQGKVPTAQPVKKSGPPAKLVPTKKE